MSYLALFFLGQPRVELNGATVKIPLQKGVALLAYLAVTGECHSRETLAAFFWPEYSQDAALNTLRVNLHTLRKVLGEEWFVVDRDTIGMTSNPNLWVDVRHFHNLLARCQSHSHSMADACLDCLPILTEAIRLYRGNFLAGFTLQDSETFDEWQRWQQVTLSQEAADILQKLVHCHSARGEFSQAIIYAQQWLAMDPLNETAHQALMRLYAWSDQRSAALNQYQECVQILEKELGESPRETTLELFQAIKEYRLRPPAVFDNIVEFSPRPINFLSSSSPFFGRKKELTDIASLLRDPACRLLNLIGPSGIGKTRLALQAAIDNTSVFPNGVWYVPLVAVHSPDLISMAIMEALGISVDGEMDIQQQLFNHLRTRKALLILDNFEHLIDGAEIVAEILRRSTNTKILVTSCERLGLQLEWLYPVQGLEYPDVETDAIEDYSAVQLFIQSARRVNAMFFLTKANYPHVISICRSLHGMPLGIELAASWTQVLSCQEIDAEIKRDLDFLSVSAQDIPERHRSLRAVFEHSWSLLSDSEKDAIRKLSVFQGGFQREAAERVAGADLAVLSSLTSKSFLHRSSTGRYEILEILRKYAEEKLQQERLAHEATHDRLAEYFADFLQRREMQLKGARQIEALKEITEEIENIRAAWRWMVEREKLSEIDRSQESLHLFYNMRSWLQEGVEIFDDAVKRLRLRSNATGENDQIRLILARLLARQGYFYDRIGRYDDARVVLEESLSILSRLGVDGETSMPLRSLARVFLDLENYVEARRLFQKSLEISEKYADRWGIVRCLDSLGFIALCLEDYVDARQRLERGLLISRESGDQWGTAWCLMDLGFLALVQREYEEANRVLEECLGTCKTIGDWQGIATTLSYLALVAVGRGEYQEAMQIYQKELASWQELGYQLGTACALVDLGFLLFMLEEYDEAHKYLQDALDTALVSQSVPTAMRALAGVVTLLRKEGKKEDAYELVERTLYHPAVYGKVKEISRQLFSSADLSLQVYAQHNTILYREFVNSIQEINKIAQTILQG